MRSKRGRISVLLALPLVLLLLSAGAGYAAVSSNIPLESRVYRDIEYLEVQGFVKSAMSSTRPFTWDEGMRLYLEANARWASLSEGGRARYSRAGGAIKRLSTLLERHTTGGYDGASGTGGVVSFRPSRLYSSYLYSGNSPVFPARNNNGDTPGEGSNFRAGLDAELGVLDAAVIYLNPEYRSGPQGPSDSAGSEVHIERAYILADAWNFQLEAGRDSMWWGAGYNGGLLMTNNAAPLDMIKLTAARPFTLPWIFGHIGLIKPTVFIARLGEQRRWPRANLLGMRIDIKPSPHFQLGFNRTFVFGGQGKRSPTLREWFRVFVASDSAEHAESPINGDQLASIDASFVYSFYSPWMPFSGVKLYTEWGAEDSGGKARLPTGRANIYGMYLTGPLWISNADLRVEWANTGRNERYGPLWYEHAIYSTGYRHDGRIIGHHAGGDARDLFARLQYQTPGGLTLGVEYEHMDTGLHSASKTLREWYEADFDYILGESVSAGGFFGYERAAGADNSVAGLSLSWDW